MRLDRNATISNMGMAEIAVCMKSSRLIIGLTDQCRSPRKIQLRV
ncbi:uncharacterized protein METZ01_LOCUS138688 [marine metagenome]|uniref:Uncharacterized protein n=1 Tax=marine metagenome TaxID=408172 RepID=A0A381Z9L7_9ZZZZ